jgi:hypothetical protein
MATPNLNEIEVLLNKHALNKARIEKLLEVHGYGTTSATKEDEERDRKQEEELRNHNEELYV